MSMLLISTETYAGEKFEIINRGWPPNPFTSTKRIQPLSAQQKIRGELERVTDALTKLEAEEPSVRQPLPAEFEQILLSALCRIAAACNEF